MSPRRHCDENPNVRKRRGNDERHMLIERIFVNLIIRRYCVFLQKIIIFGGVSRSTYARNKNARGSFRTYSLICVTRVE